MSELSLKGCNHTALTNRQLVARFMSDKDAVKANVEQCLQRIDTHNSTVNAIVTQNTCIMVDVNDLDKRHTTNTSLLYGLPVSIKDVYETKGLLTTAGYAPLKSYVPNKDAVLVQRLKNAGALVIGKSNTAELAGDVQCRNKIFGATNNPWDTNKTSGGSSGGSAVSVAMGFSVLDIGSDLAGSIRIPASFCGVAGLKTTENRLPRTGHIPPLPTQERSVHHLLSLGLLARYVDDLRLGLEALDGADVSDSLVPPIHTAQPKVIQKSTLKIAYWDDFGGVPLCQRTKNALQHTIKTLQTAGITVERAKPLGFEFDKAWQAYGAIMGAEVGLGIPNALRALLGFGSLFAPKSHFLLKSVGVGMRLNMRHYNQALAIREMLVASLEEFLINYDVWLCPTVPTTAFEHCKPNQKITIAERRIAYLEAVTTLVTPFSLTGSPVVSLPVGIFDGLPVGVQLIGRRWQDEQLLNDAEIVESIVQGFSYPKAYLDI